MACMSERYSILSWRESEKGKPREREGQRKKRMKERKKRRRK